MTDPAATLTSVVINVVDGEREKAFWTALLGVGVAREFASFTWLDPQSPGGVCLALQVTGEAKEGPNRVHLDLVVADLDATAHRIEEIGGRHVEDHEIAGFHWKVMADPEGNEFCILGGG